MTSSSPLYLIDGSGYIFRAYYAIRPLSMRDGTPTQAVVGFARMMLKFMREKTPQHIAMIFDRPEPTFRHKLYTEYKATREKMPEE